MTEQLIDDFGRRVRYVRISVTDRCDFRCVYCMSEEMTFLPRAQVLTLEELAMVARAFTELGVEKIRLTGGEPLVRKGIEQLVDEIGALPGLDDFTMTTNGASLRKHAKRLYDGGLRRLNISLNVVAGVEGLCPGVVRHIAQRHLLDKANIEALLTGKGHQVEHFVFVTPLQDHCVQLDALEARLFGGVNAVDHLG